MGLVRPLHVSGFTGMGQELKPLGNMLLPGEPEARFETSRACVEAVISSGEYRYTRAQVERPRVLVDVGFNLAAFTIWAVRCWWPGTIEVVHGYEPNAQALAIARENLQLVYPGMAPPRQVNLHHAAVTTAERPLFLPHGPDGRDNWGGGYTHGVTEGLEVPALHPRDLPPCDVLKVDAEGIEDELTAEYQHWAGVRVFLFEWHHVEHRGRIMKRCVDAGLVQWSADQGEQWGIGQQVWGRP